MGVMINREAYQKLIDEDIEWLLKQPQSLERDHIVSVLKNSVERIYGKEKMDEAYRLNCLIHLF